MPYLPETRFTFRAHDIHHLRADFTYQLRLFLAFLLFLFVKDRAERVVRVLTLVSPRTTEVKESQPHYTVGYAPKWRQKTAQSAA
ncbi:hypothetical protein SOV99_20015 [Pectobacterium aroidearum]|nr:hypothetical protein [Pectobacterium aroidearum]